MSIEQQTTTMNDQLSISSTDLDQQSSLALVSVRPPTPDKCAVCLNNKQNDIIARIDSCSHTFCFSCILEWSKVRAICPLCKQPFHLITRERYSGDIVEEIRVQTPRRPPATTFTNINDVLTWVDQHRIRPESTHENRGNDLFRQMVYIEWLNTIQAIVPRPNNNSRNPSLSPLVRTANPSSSWSNLIPLDSIRRLLHRYLRQTTSELRQSTIYSQSTRQTVAFRKYIYLNRLHIHSPLIGQNHDTLTVRECSPTWYASNPACLHRLVPFLARELLALLWNDERTIEYIIQEILTTIQLHEIRSNTLTRKLTEYLGQYTKHFLHEFYTFARCPYDLAGFDRHAQYPIMNSTSSISTPMEISLDDDDGDEQRPIILDETPDLSIEITDIASSSASSSSSSPTTIESDQRSSPECEIVEYVEPTQPIREISPTLIVLSEDDDDTTDEEEEEEEIEVTSSSSSKRKHRHHHHKSKKQQTTSMTNLNSSTSVILDDDDEEEQVSNSNQQQPKEEEEQQQR